MNLLVLDDDPIVCESIRTSLSEKYRAVIAHTFDEAVEHCARVEFDGAIIDLNLGDSAISGVEFLSWFKNRYPDRPVIVGSGNRDIPLVVNCIKAGAEDYLEKPFNETTLHIKVERVFSESRRKKVWCRSLEKHYDRYAIIGNSHTLIRAKKAVERARDLRILFIGETGVGKTPFAWYSNRVVAQQTGEPRPFEQINCAALSAEHFQDQMFGHKKGGFTGAVADKKGLVELAEGGDLFLDEVGDMPLEAQANFLTFLDTKEYYRMGDDRKRQANVRVLCATNRDLKARIEQGLFRKDLYSRIAQVVIPLAPLRDRAEDIPVLIDYFIQHFTGYAKKCDPAIAALFTRFRWEEGNVRELKDAVEFMCVMARDSESITPQHLSDRYYPIGARGAFSPAHAKVDMDVVFELGLESYLEELEKGVLTNCIAQRECTLENLSKRLKVSRPTLYRRMRKYDLADLCSTENR